MKLHALYVRILTGCAERIQQGAGAQALSGQRSATETENAERRRSERHVGDEQIQQAAARRARHHAGGLVSAGSQPPGHRGMLSQAPFATKQHVYMH